MSEHQTGKISVFSALDYQALRSCVVRTLKHAENTRADVLLLTHQGETAVMKDYAGSNKGFSLLLAPFLVYREVKALKKLHGIRGIPQLIKKSSARSFVMEYLNAGSLKQAGADFDWEAFIGDSQSLVASINQRGVVHGDLRNASNILVDQNRHPVLSTPGTSGFHRGQWAANTFVSALLSRHQAAWGRTSWFQNRQSG